VSRRIFSLAVRVEARRICSLAGRVEARRIFSLAVRVEARRIFSLAVRVEARRIFQPCSSCRGEEDFSALQFVLFPSLPLAVRVIFAARARVEMSQMNTNCKWKRRKLHELQG